MLTIEDFPSKIVNAGQPMVGNTLRVNIDYYPVDKLNPAQRCTKILMLGYLKNPTLTLGNHDKSFKVF
jgi:hypothetical protein